MNQQSSQTEETVTLSQPSTPQATIAAQEAEHRTPAALHNADTEMVSRLLPVFEAETRRYQRRVRSAIRLGVTGAILVTLVNTVAVAVAAQLGTEFPLAITVGMMTLYVLLLLAGVILPLRSGARRNSLRELLVRCDDVRVVGPLTEMLASSDSETRRMSAAMLTELLPRLQSTGARLLDAEQIALLGDVLRNGAREDHELAVAIVRAFAQVGDSSVLPLVERIADSPAHTRRRRRLKAEAEACLPFLQAHVRQEQASRTLLRASAPGSGGPDTLLRPAGSANSDPGQLLRESGNEGVQFNERV